MDIYEIKEYSDGGPNDKGSLVTYVLANSKKEARKMAAKKMNNQEIVTTGFFEAHIVHRIIYRQRKEIAVEQWKLYKDI